MSKKKVSMIVLAIVLVLGLTLSVVLLVASQKERVRSEWKDRTELALRAQTEMDFNDTPLLPVSGIFEVPDENGKPQKIFFEGSDKSLMITSEVLLAVFRFTTDPSAVDIQISNQQDIEFEGTIEEFESFVPKTNDSYHYLVTVYYEEETFSGYCDYEFLVDYTAQPKFTLSADEVEQGGVLLLLGANLRTQDVDIQVEYNFEPQVVFSRTNCVAYLPFNFVREPGDYTVTVIYEGNTYELPYTVTPGDFDVQYLTVDEHITNSTIGNNAAREEYNKTVYGLLDTFDPNIYWTGTFIQPVEGWISTEYGAQRYTNGVRTSGHDGIDIATDEGTPIVATNGAKVLYSGYLTVSGYTIILDHGMGLHTLHLHMSGVHVEEGDMVAQGDIIGYVGATGYATGPHLHFSMYVRGHAVNPWRAFDGTAGFYAMEGLGF